MTSLKIPASKPQVAPDFRLSRALTAQTLLAVERRLADTERELRIQFTRIAQLQAEIDLMSATLRRVTDTGAVSLADERDRSHRAVEHGSV